MGFSHLSLNSSGLVCLILFSLTICSGIADSASNFDNANELLDEAKFQQYGNYINGLKRAAGFVGMRGKKDNVDDSVNVDDADVHLDEDLAQYFFGPRPARAGFVGMRGKKEDESLYEKRAGFVGMRGKKSPNFFPYWLVHQPTHFGSDAGLEPSKARRASSGFVGMRGR